MPARPPACPSVRPSVSPFGRLPGLFLDWLGVSRAKESARSFICSPDVFPVGRTSDVGRRRSSDCPTDSVSNPARCIASVENIIGKCRDVPESEEDVEKESVKKNKGTTFIHTPLRHLNCPPRLVGALRLLCRSLCLIRPDRSLRTAEVIRRRDVRTTRDARNLCGNAVGRRNSTVSNEIPRQLHTVASFESLLEWAHPAHCTRRFDRHDSRLSPCW